MLASIATRSRGQGTESASPHFTAAVRREILVSLKVLAPEAARRELQSLEGEEDPELFLQALLAFGGRQERGDRPELAAQVYNAICGTGFLAAPSFQRARQHLDALIGRGALGNQIEALSGRLVREAFQPWALAGMVGAQAIFGVARAAFLSRLLASPTPGLITRGFGARALASTGAFLLEAPSFSAFTRLGKAAMGLPQDWSPAALGREAAGSFLTLGSMKMMGRWPIHHAGLLGGILLGQRLEEMTGLREATSGVHALASAMATFLQFKLAGRLISGALGPRWAAFNRELHWRSETSAPGNNGFEYPGLVVADGPPGNLPVRQAEPSRIVAERWLMSGESDGSQAGPSLLKRWQSLLAEAQEKGQNSELRDLRDLVLELNRRQPVDWLHNVGSVPFKAWLSSENDQLWRQALPHLAQTIERCPGFFRLVENSEALQEFLSHWESRPHFADLKQVSVELGEYTGNKGNAQRWLRNLRQAMVEDATLEGWRAFVQERKEKGESLDFEAGPHSREGRVVLANWQDMGLSLRFDARGHFVPPIRVRPVYAEEQMSRELSPTHTWSLLLDSVEQQATTAELRNFKNLVLQAFTAQNGAALGEKTARRLNSPDPEDWHTGLRVLRGMLESYSCLPSLQEASREMLEFRRKWEADRRYIEFKPAPPRSSSPAPAMLAAKTPATPPPPPAPVPSQPPMPQPLAVSTNPPAPESHPAPVPEAPKTPKPEPTPAPTREAPVRRYFYRPTVVPLAIQLGPKKDESPMEWALRLDYESRNGHENLLPRMMEELTARLKHPGLRASTLEMIRYLKAVTSTQSGRRIELRYRSIPGSEDSLTLAGLPASYLGETWPWSFAESLVLEVKAGSPLPKVLEFNSGPAGISVLLAKLGLAQDIVALDPNPQAPAVGGLNAALNGIQGGIKFRSNGNLESLPEPWKADFLFASFPKGPILDSEELSRMGGFLGQSHSKLHPNSRAFFNVAGYPGKASLEVIFQRRGFQPVIRQIEWVRQDHGTGFERLVKWEKDINLPLEFFRKEKLDTPIPAKEAAKVPEIYYRRYLIEAKPRSEPK